MIKKTKSKSKKKSKSQKNKLFWSCCVVESSIQEYLEKFMIIYFTDPEPDKNKVYEVEPLLCFKPFDTKNDAEYYLKMMKRHFIQPTIVMGKDVVFK